MRNKLQQMRLIGTTDALGAATINGDHFVVGRLFAVKWVDGALDDGGSGTLTAQNGDAADTLLTLANPKANADKLYYPRALAQGDDGADLTGVYAMPLIYGTPRLVIASGGATKAGGGCILFYLED